jgi:hypothetical protein
VTVAVTVSVVVTGAARVDPLQPAHTATAIVAAVSCLILMTSTPRPVPRDAFS